LQTDDPQQGLYGLPVEASIRPDLSVDAARKRFPAISQKEHPSLSFAFSRETGEALTLSVETLPAHLKAEVQTFGARAEVRLQLDPDRIPADQLEGLEILKVRTNVEDQPEWTLFAAWTLTPPLLSEPVHLVFHRQEVLEIQLHRPDGKPFALESVLVEGDDFEVRTWSRSLNPKQTVVLGRRRAAGSKGSLKLLIKGEARSVNLPLVNLPE
jgi:hypothetical protein